MLTLCDFYGRDDHRFSPYAWRSKLALAHKGLDFDTIGITFTDKSALEPWTDHRLAPVLNHDSAIICDSWAIAVHLERAFADRPPLFPDAGSRRLSQFLNGWVPRALYPLLLPMIAVDVVRHVHRDDVAHYRSTREDRLGMSLEDAAADPGAADRFDQALEPLRDLLRTWDFLDGEAPGYSDFIVAGLFLWVRGSSPRHVLRDDDVLYAWRRRIFDRHRDVIAASSGYDD